MSKKQNTTLSVTTIGKTVPDALTILKEELRNLKTITETQYKTGSDYKVSGFGNSISTETSVETLIKMHSSVAGREAAYNNSQSTLSEVAGVSISAPPFKDNGYSLASIESDIALRIKVLNVSERKTELENLLKEAEGFLTKEDQFKMFQQKLEDFLKK